ncbi:hypothetical protein KAW48_01720 [candidate division WOR-3 bacterium]|nr:hypothetical protein [candidate division WOR-3 bacterium]
MDFQNEIKDKQVIYEEGFKGKFYTWQPPKILLAILEKLVVSILYETLSQEIKFNAFCSGVVLTKPQSISPARKSLLPLSDSLFLISKEIKKPCPLVLREDFVTTIPSP